MEQIAPGSVGEEVENQTPPWTGEHTLIGTLKLVKKDGLGAGTPVDVSKYVKAGLDAPHFTEEKRAAKVKVTVIFL